MLISLNLALIFNLLFFGEMLGISVVLFTVLLVAAVVLFALREKMALKKHFWMIPCIIFFALMPGVRDSEFLTFLNICATFGLLLLFAHQLSGTPVFLLKLREYISVLILVPLRMVGRSWFTMSKIGQIHSSLKHRETGLRVLKGVLMAVPILVLFGILFSQADLAFGQFMKGIINVHISESTFRYILLLVFAFVASLGFLSYIFFPKHVEPKSLQQSSVTARSDKGIEVMVFLGLISVLFVLFIGFQITYLFGGEAQISTASFTYSEYARRGFWELLAVSAITLVLLLASETYARTTSKNNPKFLVPALILIAEVGIVILSAFKRLSLYIDAYGMTTLRFYVIGFIILLAALFVLVAVKFIGSKQEQFFAFGTLLSVIAFLAVINLMNPDALIASVNLERYRAIGKIDASYVAGLSSDAEAWKIWLYTNVTGDDKRILREALQEDRDKLGQPDIPWQSANFSRSQALKLLQGFEE